MHKETAGEGVPRCLACSEGPIKTASVVIWERGECPRLFHLERRLSLSLGGVDIIRARSLGTSKGKQHLHNTLEGIKALFIGDLI